MSDRPIATRRPLAMGAALLVAAAAFFATTAGPVAAGRPFEFTVTPDTAPVGATVTAASDVPCYITDAVPTVEVTLVDAGDNEIFGTGTSVDGEGNWTIDIATAGLEAGDYTVKARCVYGEGQFNNYQSETLTLTAAAETTTTSEAPTSTTEASTSTTTDTPTTGGPTTTVAPSVNNTAAAAPAGAVASTPNYTG